MQKEYLIDLEDARVVVRDQNGGVRLKQAINLVGAAARAAAARAWPSMLDFQDEVRLRGWRKACLVS
jgi:uncharacterized membrane protein